MIQLIQIMPPPRKDIGLALLSTVQLYQKWKVLKEFDSWFQAQNNNPATLLYHIFV